MAGDILLPKIVVHVHPVSRVAHPTIPAGWRWAVTVGGARPSDLTRCANAGFTPTVKAARSMGDRCAATAVKAARMFGVPVEYGGVVQLDHDPIPAETTALSTIPPLGG